MPNPESYEPLALYKQRQQFLTQSSAEREQITAAMQPKRPGGLLGGLMTGLEYLGRPLSATTSTIGYGMTGRNPLTGFMAGLRGESEFRTFEDILKQAGMGEGPRLGPITARGALGFVGSIPLDPLSYLPIGRGVKAMGEIARFGKGVERLAPEVAEVIPKGTSIAQEIATGFRPSTLGRATEAAAKVPVIGGLVRKMSNLISPKILAAREESKALIGFYNRLSQGDDLAQKSAAWFRANPLDTPVGEQGFVFPGGTRATRDVLQNPEQYWSPGGKLLTDKDLVWSKNYQGVVGQHRAEYQRVLEEFEGINPEAAKRFHVQNIHLEPGEEWVPSYGIAPEGDIVPVAGYATGGTLASFQRPRGFLSQQEALAKGVQYRHIADPVENLEHFIKDVNNQIGNMELAMALTPLSKQIDVDRLRYLGSLVKNMQGEQALATQLKGVAQDIASGATISAKDLEPFRQAYPGIVDRLGRIMSRTVKKTPFTVTQKLKEKLAPEIAVSKTTFFDTAYSPLLKKEAGQLAPLRTVTPTRTMKGVLKDIDEAIELTKDRVAGAREILKGTAAYEKAEIAGRKAVGYPAFKNMWFTPEQAGEIAAKLGATAHPALKTANQLVSLVRTTVTTGDAAAGFLQGQVLLVTNPFLWLKAQAFAIRALIDPSSVAKYVASPASQEVYRQAPNIAIRGAGREFFEGMAPGSILGRMGEKVPAAKTAIEQTFGRAQAAFEGFGVYARTEWTKALLPTATKFGKVRQMEDFINHATGVFSLPAIGVSPTQRAAESFLFFAPQYTRSILAVVGDAIQGGMAGNEARKALASLALVGPWMYVRTADALGQEPVLDPSDSKFMTLQVGDTRMGIGGTWLALSRLVTRSIADENTGETDFTRALSWDSNNPIIRFWRGKSSPALGSLWDVAMQENYLGEPLDTPVDIAKYMGTRVLPFSLQALLLQNQPTSVTERLTEAGAQFTGLRAFPMGFKEQRERQAREMFGGRGYEALSPEEQVQVEKTPEIEAIPLPRGRKFERMRQQEQIFGNYGQQLESYAQEIQKGTMGKERFRILESELADKRNAQLEMLGERKPTGQVPEQERLRQEYLAKFRERGPQGQINYEGAEEFYSTLSGEVQRYIEDKQRASLGRLPDNAASLMKELWDARRKLEPYWELREKTMKRLGIWDKWQGMNPAEQDKFVDNPLYKRAQTLWDGERKRMRWAKPEIDKALAEWYGLTPIRQQRG